jgi:hypothetical protein
MSLPNVALKACDTSNPVTVESWVGGVFAADGACGTGARCYAVILAGFGAAGAEVPTEFARKSLNQGVTSSCKSTTSEEAIIDVND